MTQEQIRAKSAAKVKQVLELAKVLHLRVVPKRRMDSEGFIEDMVYWIDEEQYPVEPVAPTGPVAASPAPEAVAPTGGTGNNA